MAQYGRYDPKNVENTSTLFTYQEVPVTSSKINRWDGNIAVAFELFHRICSALFAKNVSAVITHTGNSSLCVQQAATPNMTVNVQPGWAMLERSFAGLLDEQSLPLGGVFSAPTGNPRIDLIVLNGSGELDTVEGSESSSPEPPATPGDSIVLAQIYQRVGAVQILSEDNGVQSYISDVRPRLLLGEAHNHGPDTSPSESPDGVRMQFPTLHVFRSGSMEVYVNGILQHKGVDYNEDSDCHGYTFTYAPLSHYKIQHRYIVYYEVE